MKVLGISAYFHDAAAALAVDGELVAAAQEERFTRIKHDASLPVEAAAFCLKEVGLSASDLDRVVFYEDPLLKFERILMSSLREFPRGLGRFSRAMSTWLSKRLWMKAELAEAFDVQEEKILFSKHHLSHAASSFFSSPFDEAAVVTVDGVGEWATTSIFHGQGTELELLGELRFPHSIGLVYSALTAYLGFRVNEGEYKVMGLAAYGEPRYLDALHRICRIEEDGALEVDRRYFAFPYDAKKSFTPALEALLGPARRPDQPITEEPRFADVAASIQRFTEDYLLLLARRARTLTGAEHLCLAGGVALNGVANARLQRESGFRSLFVHPAAGDAGGAVGAALWASHALLGVPRRKSVSCPYLGKAYPAEEIGRFLKNCRVKHVRFERVETLLDVVADRLASGQIGGWFSGRFEWGPRALGSRSILADPRHAGARERVNASIKFREAFRPFAPAVLAEEITRWFDVPSDDHLTPFMCAVAPATEEAKRTIPAVVHVDGTGRVQRVDRTTAPAFHRLLERFRDKTGVGVLLNTSMNLKDEPIVGSPVEAYATFLRSDLDFLVLEDCLVTKRSTA